MNQGIVKEIVGVVVDVDFSGGELPAIHNALEISRSGRRLVLEVQQKLMVAILFLVLLLQRVVVQEDLRMMRVMQVDHLEVVEVQVLLLLLAQQDRVILVVLVRIQDIMLVEVEAEDRSTHIW